MSIFNRRNALLGWAVWEGAKVSRRFKRAKASLPLVAADDAPRAKRKRKALVAGIAAGAGALMFWRSRSSSDISSGDEL